MFQVYVCSYMSENICPCISNYITIQPGNRLECQRWKNSSTIYLCGLNYHFASYIKCLND